MVKRFCNQCGTAIPPSARFCPLCGNSTAPVTPATMHTVPRQAQGSQSPQPACQRCGHAFDWRSGVCHTCGTINEIVLLSVTESHLRDGGLVNRHSVVATNRALRFRNPKVFGVREDFIEIPYTHIESLQKKSGLRGSKLLIRSGVFGTIVLDAISDQDANRIIATYKQYALAPRW